LETLDKGGVEGSVGHFRRNYLTPVPKVGPGGDAAAAVAAAVSAGVAAELGRVIGDRPATIGQDLAVERKSLAPAPGRFDAVTVESRKADQKARVSVRGAKYSVPTSLAGRRVQVLVGAEEVRVVGPEGSVVAAHERLPRGEHLVLDHYLEALVRKPGALPGSLALATARREGLFTVEHDRWWRMARRSLGDQKGTKALIDVLLGTRRLPPDAVREALGRCLEASITSPDAVVVEARQACPAVVAPPVVVDLAGAARVVGAAAAGPPTLDGYDDHAKAA
jgi:hypothetical protein